MKRLLLLAAFLFVAASAGAADYQVLDKGAVHEAYITPEMGELILRAVPEQPPRDLSEQIPLNDQLTTEWVPGYWSWDFDRGDFIWVSGIWRQPPPGHEWTQGRWKQYPEGWVWLRGFWAPIPEPAFTYIATIPPTALDEKASNPPRPEKDYFWIPGYWHYDTAKKDYVWYSGRWNHFDENWIYVPAHYEWREKGYILIPGYWDFPLEKRGVLYACIYVDPDARETLVFAPTVIWEPLYIMEMLYPCWPCHPCLYQWHYHFFYDDWVAWGAIPPWWGWSSWWALPWPQCQALWWWWCHDGYPHPFWMTDALAQMIAPPPGFVLKMMKDVNPLLIVTKNGVVTPDALAEAIEEITGVDLPIMPVDEDEVEAIQEEASGEIPEGPYPRPTGKGKVSPPPAKPSFGSEERKDPRKLVPIPDLPDMEFEPIEVEHPQVKPVPPPRRVAPKPQPRPQYRPQPKPRPQPQYQPEPKPRPKPRPDSGTYYPDRRPYYPQPEKPPESTGPIPYPSPGHTRSQHPPRSTPTKPFQPSQTPEWGGEIPQTTPPSQGRTPSYLYPKIPMQTQSHNRIQSKIHTQDIPPYRRQQQLEAKPYPHSDHERRDFNQFY